MPRGITEQQVHTAADALVAAGERPTVERIRQHLGTGSPNTVTRWLESWWQALGARLAAQAQKVALPQAPEPVRALASQLWEQALATAAAHAEAGVAHRRQALADEREAARAAITQAEKHAATARATADDATAALANANERLADRHALVDQQAQHIADLVAQRDAAVRRADQQEADAAALRARLEQGQIEAEAARETQAAQVRHVEDRAHAEVDRARQEARALRRQLKGDEEVHATQVRQLQAEVQQLRATVAEFGRELAAAHATRDGLEVQLADLRHSLHQVLKARPATPKTPRRARRSRPQKQS